MYAQLPVFQYQTFDQGGLSFTPTPAAPPTTAPLRYFGVVTDLPPKSEEAPKEAPAEPETTDTPADPPSDPAAVAEGRRQHNPLLEKST
jgi:hypothetical protein